MQLLTLPVITKLHIYQLLLNLLQKYDKPHSVLRIKVSGLLPGVILGHKVTFQDYCLSLLQDE